MQQPILGCLSQSIQALLSFTMLCILGNDQWIVEEDTFRLGPTDVMFIRTLAAVAVVPVKPGDLVKADHGVYVQYIQIEALMQYRFLSRRLKGMLHAMRFGQDSITPHRVKYKKLTL
jgi:hypothetical protein